MENQNNSSSQYVISPTKVAIVAGIIIFLLLAIAPGYYLFRKYQNAQKQLPQIKLIPQEDGQTILEKVKKLKKLPVDEEPTIVTILDRDKVKNQPFFAKAKNRDKVIIFNKNKIAILYDSVNNKIIEMGPLILPSVSPEKEASSTNNISP